MTTQEVATQDEIVPTTVLTFPTPQNLEAFQQGLRYEYEYELSEAEADYDAAQKRGGGHLSQLSRAFRRVVRAKLKLQALDNGYFPVPRMPVEYVWPERLEEFKAPEQVKQRLIEAEKAGIFEEIVMVVPEPPRTRRNAGLFHRDPLLIGVIGARTVTEEHFLIAWWR